MLRLELYKHFVKPGYQRISKNLTIFSDDDEKEGKLNSEFLSLDMKGKKSEEKKKKKDKKDKKDKKHKKEKKEKKEKKDKKEKKEKKD